MVTAGTVLWFGRGKDEHSVDIGQCDQLPQVKYGADLLGAIVLDVNGTEVLDRDLVDDIVMMWVYVANVVNEYQNGRPAKTSLPDQGIYFSLKPLPRGQVLVSVEGAGDRRAAVADADEVLFALRLAGNEFFDKMEELTGRFWPKVRSCLNSGSEFR